MLLPERWVIVQSYEKVVDGEDWGGWYFRCLRCSGTAYVGRWAERRNPGSFDRVVMEHNACARRAAA